ncbi:group II intron reverse transcriptase/maturase [Legionella geestiana]|uniref:group II intron reverse transcriptase/maturase n=1 Tax=Legionella geestiana TaxID=45065 RepID=UPI0010925103|nr:group II intron reverse transcriptase/maturase [Legionella geestiana]QDQ38949.1 group II intron reverse transcriptase/maturase [Legionella geestiana]QDQ39182.1 group II intron reverse transcriptase/maturase [Legionella geestiana]QDQ39762.1 group II intron reverse transcriptase/maturase [Legionella geestiana]QDQ39763.1 group II intron reverse transcriptase/maturase [Legionella geestiana]QDQ40504.1 group II intron reverse transcriptase/maturase [Legionella geestiana]
MTVQTADGKQQTTKLECISRRARLQKDTVFNNIGHALDIDLLRECYQELDGKKATGIDKVTKEAYGKKLGDNLQDLLARIRRCAYKPQASKLVEIPKEDGSTRPLAISCFEDKIVQMAASKLLTAIYEPLFLPCSYGYREGVNGHEALRALMKYSNQFHEGATLEIDLRKYFNTIPHDKLLEILEQKITDKRFLKLITKLIRSPVLVNGKAELNTLGCPQGSIISPILSNIYLHHVIDCWFDEISKSHLKGKTAMVRFADDMVFLFQRGEEAERFYNVLPKRLEKHGLQLNADKSSLLKSGSREAERAEERGKRLKTYNFLGFVCYWGKSRNGKRWRLKFKSRSDRFTAKLRGLREYLKKSLNRDTETTMERIKRIAVGWINYHAISDNQKRVHSFLKESKKAILNWIRRKGGKRKTNWATFNKILEKIKYPQSFKTISMFSTC